MRKKKRICLGFTLIELLIVVAIIGILAAIAIPNFLEAQTRAKVARAKAEFRTLQTGMELYYVDYNDYPLNWYDLGSNPQFARIGSRYTAMGMHYTRYCLPQLTTPTSYLSSVDFDDPFPFMQNLNQGYFYAHNDPGDIVYGLYWHQPDLYCFVSPGPDRLMHEDWKVMPGYPQGNWVEYDPTNGTVSSGNITKYGPQ